MIKNSTLFSCNLLGPAKSWAFELRSLISSIYSGATPPEARRETLIELGNKNIMAVKYPLLYLEGGKLAFWDQNILYGWGLWADKFKILNICITHFESFVMYLIFCHNRYLLKVITLLTSSEFMWN